MEYKVKSVQCPKCGCTEIIATQLNGYAVAAADVSFPLRSSPLMLEVCANCGYVAASYVRDPQNLTRHRKFNV